MNTKGPEEDENIKPDDTVELKGSMDMAVPLVDIEAYYADLQLAGFSILGGPGMCFPIPVIKCFIKQLLTDLQYCQAHQILHGDVGGSNLLPENNALLKIGYRGYARSFTDNFPHLANRVNTLWCRPPELLLGSMWYTPAAIMWSIGVMLADLIHGKPILPGSTESEQFNMICELCGSPDETNWPDVSSFDRHALDLLDRVLTLNPEDRISAKDALDAEFFQVEPCLCDHRATYESAE